MNAPCSSITATFGSIASLPVKVTGSAFSVQVEAPAGLYQLQVVADAGDFDFEDLYFNLDKFHNDNVRTGPWDFDFNHGNCPLVPSYWVTLDGQRLGLWFFQRISLDDLEHRRFRGRLAFWLREGGQHELSLEPYRDLPITWATARLETDPEDRLEVLPPLQSAAATLDLARWSDTGTQSAMRQRLASTHAKFRPLLDTVVEAAMTREKPAVHDLPVLAFAYYIDGRTGARDRAVRAIDEALALPAWGNPKPDGYGHNGDMGAMSTIKALALALHAWRAELGEERLARMRQKLAEQGERFIEQALLTRDYWGGSLLQDHGWKSHWGMAEAALLLYGEVPEAQTWLTFCLPRVRRSLAAIPRDGAIPQSSYCVPWLYLDPLSSFRAVYLAMGGEDIYELGPLAGVVDYLYQVYDDRTGRMASGRQGDTLPPTGGYQFLHQMATLHQDGRAAWLAERFLALEHDGFFHGTHRAGYYDQILWAYLSYDPAVSPEAPSAAMSLGYYNDSGIVHYRSKRLTFFTKCGPGCGYHSLHQAPGPCDRLAFGLDAGHFTLALDGQPLLVTPDGGYRLKTFLNSCLLIGERGQSGDIGYPMSIPSFEYRGERIEAVSQDGDCVRIRLDLTKAYADDLGVALYTREFLIEGDREVICRDHVQLDRPQQLSWLFQGKPEFGIALDGLLGRLGKGPAFRLEPQTPQLALQASLATTQVVWSYASASGFKPFEHIRYHTAEPVTEGLVDFVFRLVD